MRLRRKVHHGVVTGQKLVQQRRVADVPNHKLHAPRGQPGDVCGISRIRQLVQHRHAHARVLARQVPHKVAAHEAATTRNQDVVRLKRVRHAMHPLQKSPSTSSSRQNSPMFSPCFESPRHQPNIANACPVGKKP